MATWRTSGRARERILAFGTVGSGKSHAAGTILRRTLGPDDTGYIIDIDQSWERILDAQGEEGLKVREEWRGRTRDTSYEDPDGRIVVFHVSGWEDTVWALQQVMDRCQRDDWVVVDDVTWMWADIQQWYIQKMHGTELPEFLMTHRLKEIANNTPDGKGKSPILVEWSVINSIWNREVATPFVNCTSHLYVCAAAKPLRTDGRERKEQMDMFSVVGYLPSSQWRIPGQMQTCLYMEKTVLGEWRYTTIKDREREEQEKLPWTDMTMQYLRKVAGWKVAR